jgi:ribonuclease HI
MNRRTPKSPSQLRIWQQNTHKSKLAQLYILNSASPADWDVIAIQEPWLDLFKNARGSAYWRILYPTNHLSDGASRTRSILLINTNITTDSYTQLDIPSADITAVKFVGAHGNLMLYNIYNDCNHNDSLTVLNHSLLDNPPTPADHMLWLGDFNRHHPLWESENNRHLNSSENELQPLLDLIRDHNMDLSLPPGLPTFETVTHNWTRPDNVWLSHHASNLLISCCTNPSIRPTHADHLPIITVIDMPIPRAPPKVSPDFRNIDFKDFNKTLHTKLSRDSPACRLTTKEEFNTKVDQLTTIIQDTISQHAPLRKPSPFSKRWWNTDLTALKKKKNRLSNQAHKYRDIANHPAIEEHKKAAKEFATAIEIAMKTFWTDWLENISAHHIYTANSYVSSEPSDFSSARIPSLKTSTNDLPSIATSNTDKIAALSNSFFPPPPAQASVPVNFVYPQPLPGIKFFTKERIKQTVRQLKPFKTPGPDGIPNIILSKSIDVLIDHLFYIYRAVFELDVYHDRWLTSSTLVLRKPGKPAYNVAKAYRPIGLLDTIGKLLSTMVAANLSHLAEKHSMLPPNQFGGRPGRNTTDALHLLTHKVKGAWRSGKVAVALFLDVQGAFPNTVKDQLIHNLRIRRVPICYTRLIENMLTNRKTRLHFDDIISDPIPIDNGTTQGCPLSMGLYSFYNAPLIETAANKNETAMGFVDDSMFLAIGDTLEEAHDTIRDMMERPKGGFSWSTSHNSPFELSKLALLNFPRSNNDITPTDLILTRINQDGSVTTQTINTVTSYKHLGVIIDPKLRWTNHHQKVISRATRWSHQVSRLSRMSGGIPPSRMRQLYNTVAIPAFTYAADIWFTGIRVAPSRLKRIGSVSLAKKLSSVQRRVAKLITGTLDTAAGDVLEAHSNLLPIDLLFDKILFRAATRLASLPPQHPLYSISRRASKRYVKRHRSPLHNLFHTTGVKPQALETLAATRRRPNYKPAFSTIIPSSKPDALDAAATHHNTQVTVYCDGSGCEGAIGAAAVLYTNKTEKKAIRFHLGPSEHHTVYEGELVGLLLAFHLLSSLRFKLRSYTVIGIDNQAAILALGNQKPHPAHYLLDLIHDAAENLQLFQSSLRNQGVAPNPNINPRPVNLQIHWTPGHGNFPPNERADELAKQAASGTSSPNDQLPLFLRNKTLPISLTAIRFTNLLSIRKTWKKRWKHSPRFPLINSLDKSLPSNRFLKLVEKLNRQHSAIIAQLRTGHSPLNQHLFRIHRSETPSCPHCLGLTVETVRHYLLQCPHYQHERHTLRRKLKRAADSISYLLSNPAATKPLLNFIRATKRFSFLN